MTIFSPTESIRLADLAAHAGPSPLGVWLAQVVRRLVRRRRPPMPAASGDRVREAAALRDYAMRLRSTDRRFADELLAAADRHERVGA